VALIGTAPWGNLPSATDAIKSVLCKRWALLLVYFAREDYVGAGLAGGGLDGRASSLKCSSAGRMCLQHDVLCVGQPLPALAEVAFQSSA
jgi:hypothetical protein